MSEISRDSHQTTVREHYARAASGGTSCCGTGAGNRKSESSSTPEKTYSERFGYAGEDLKDLPEGADMGLGCGNPTALAALRPGEVVLDLGSGGGIDCFLAAKAVGTEGHVIGVDMTPKMVSKARRNAAKTGAANVEFRLGEIEHLPVADATVDVILSNCVVNLSSDKKQVLRETFRVLRPGGRLEIADVLATSPLPDKLASDEGLVCGCMGNTALVSEMEGWLAETGFVEVAITVDERSRKSIAGWAPGTGIENHVASARIAAIKPA